MRDLLLPSLENDYTPNVLQRVAVLGLATLVLLSFAATNLQALLWQSSAWLVGAVLPAVVVDLTNEERGTVAALPLTRNPKLDEAARLKAEDMLAQQYFAHNSPSGVTPWYWFDAVAYDYAHAGENLAIHFSDSSAVVDAWMNSPAHRENIVNGVYTEIGVGTASGEFEGVETVFVVQLFGTPAAALQPAKPVAVAKPNSEPTAPTKEIESLALAAPEAVVLPEDVPQGSFEARATEELEQATPADTAAEVVTKTTVAEPVAEPAAPEAAREREQTQLFTATSSGLVAMSLLQHSGGTTKAYASTFGELATQPSSVLQTLYLFIGLFVSVVLLTSIMIGVRHARPLQVLYGIGLLLLMSALFTVHGNLTNNVVIASETQGISKLPG